MFPEEVSHQGLYKLGYHFRGTISCLSLIYIWVTLIHGYIDLDSTELRVLAFRNHRSLPFVSTKVPGIISQLKAENPILDLVLL
jgi:hypothetical protein